MRTPAQIALDVKRQRVREAVAAEVAERGRTSVGRIARRTGLPLEEVRELMPPLIGAAGGELAAAA